MQIRGDQIKSNARVTPGSNYVIIGTVQICWGNNTIANGGTTVTFPRAFSGTPNVTITINDTNFWGSWLIGRNANNFTAKQEYTGAALDCSWIAIGPA